VLFNKLCVTSGFVVETGLMAAYDGPMDCCIVASVDECSWQVDSVCVINAVM